MAKVIIDEAACVGCGLCEQNCPEVFEIHGDGIAHVKAHVCEQHNLEEVAQQCPVQAIKVV